MSARNALSAHRFFIRAALSTAHVFSWLFVLQYTFGITHDLSNAFVRTLLLYALAQVITILVTPFAARALVRGARRVSVFATLALSIAFAVLAATLSGTQSISSEGLLLFAVYMGLYRALYWVPYRVEESSLAARRDTIPAEIFIAAMPGLAGIVLSYGSQSSVLCAASALALISLAPLSKVPEIRERFAWGYRETFGELIEPRFRASVVSSILVGFEAGILLLVWPLFVLIFITHSYTLFGMILAATLLLAIPARRYGEKLLLGRDAWVPPLIVTAWVFRMFAAGPISVIAVDTYSIVGKGSNHGVDLYAREQAADNATYVDEVTALKEIGYAIGRLKMAVALALGITFVTLPIAMSLSFIVAALCAVYAHRMLQRTP